MKYQMQSKGGGRFTVWAAGNDLLNKLNSTCRENIKQRKASNLFWWCLWCSEFTWSHTFLLALEITQQPGEKQTGLSCCRTPIEFHFATFQNRMKRDAAVAAGIIKARWRRDELWVTSMVTVTACLASKDGAKGVEEPFSQSHDLHRWRINWM